MSSAQSRSAQQLAEVLATLASSSTPRAAAQNGIERIAESFEAEVGAIVRVPEVLAAVGFPADEIPVSQLLDAAQGNCSELWVPGPGRCQLVVVPVPSDPSGLMLLARSGEQGFDREELSLVRSMARILATALDMLTVLAARREAEEALSHARDTANEASRLKSQFLANASHEIRTPMTVIIGLTELLEDTPLDPIQRKFVDGLSKASGGLLSIINDILDFSKIEAGRVILEETEFEPGQVVEDVGSLLAETARAKGLELVSHFDPSLPALVRGDPGRLRQIILNLASNAVKFTSAGAVVVHARANRFQDETVVVRVEVTDTGIGIASRDQWRLFEPFSQVDSSNTRQYGGTGLGLAICRQLTEAMGGELGVESTLGEGSRFWFEIPFHTVAPAATPLSPPRPLQGVRALVVDDNDTSSAMIVRLLESWGFDADATASGAAALVRLEEAIAEGRPYRVALLDRHMPAMGGLELARRIRARRALDGTALLLLGSTTAVDDEGATVAGIRACLPKPVRQSQLLASLSAALHVPSATSPHDGPASTSQLTVRAG